VCRCHTPRHIRFRNEGHGIGSYTPPLWVDALQRFLPQGSRLGPMAPPPEAVNAEYPCTLDLRRGGAGLATGSGGRKAERRGRRKA